MFVLHRACMCEVSKLFLIEMYRMHGNFGIDETTSMSLPLPTGIYYGQYDKLNRINDLIYDRNVPLSGLSPNMEARSIPTRNTVYPVNDLRTKYNRSQYLDNEAGQSSNISRPVDIESQLRNQCFALQHGAPQGVYVPGSESDLYRVLIPVTANPIPQPFPNLFSIPKMTTEPPPMGEKIGNAKFMNNTRTQLRNII